MKQNVTISVSEETLTKIQECYQNDLVTAKGEYILFKAQVNGVIITAFSSKKSKHKVVFMGDEALEEARRWDLDAQVNIPKEKENKKWLYFGDQIGSDEVGVGDFLLPMIVVAAFLEKKDYKVLTSLGVRDSKQLTDQKILEIGPKLVKHFKFSKLTITNQKYNEMVAQGENLNSLKAKMHNRALYNLCKEYPDVNNIFIDQFVNEKTYYRYLENDTDPIVRNILFRTKGESYFPCVALASVIARYAFLLEKAKLEEQYQVTFPFGASNKATTFAKSFVEKHGLEELAKIAKKNFANYREVINDALL